MSRDLEATDSSPIFQGMAPWFGFFAGPVAWFLELEVVYALVPWACRGQSRLPLHLATLCCLAVVALGAWSAWLSWDAAGRQWPSGGDEGPVARERFLGTIGF